MTDIFVGLSAGCDAGWLRWGSYAVGIFFPKIAPPGPFGHIGMLIDARMS